MQLVGRRGVIPGDVSGWVKSPHFTTAQGIGGKQRKLMGLKRPAVSVSSSYPSFLSSLFSLCPTHFSGVFRRPHFNFSCSIAGLWVIFLKKRVCFFLFAFGSKRVGTPWEVAGSFIIVSASDINNLDYVMTIEMPLFFKKRKIERIKEHLGRVVSD